MAHASRNVRKARRLRRNANQAHRTGRKIAFEAQKTFAVLMAVLAQAGGDVTVVKGTLDQVSANLPRLGYTMIAGANAGEFIVRQTLEEVPLPAQNDPPADDAPPPPTEGVPA